MELNKISKYETDCCHIKIFNFCYVVVYKSTFSYEMLFVTKLILENRFKVFSGGFTDIFLNKQEVVVSCNTNVWLLLSFPNSELCNVWKICLSRLLVVSTRTASTLVLSSCWTSSEAESRILASISVNWWSHSKNKACFMVVVASVIAINVSFPAHQKLLLTTLNMLCYSMLGKLIYNIILLQ